MSATKFKTTVRQKIILGFIALFFIAATAYIKGCFSKNEIPPVNQAIITKNSDSSTSNSTNNNNVKIGNDQNNAGRDIKPDNRKIDIHGNAFFDSSKQVNNYQYGGLVQRHIDLKLMKKILDSIPSKQTPIEILCGGDGEGENLGKEISDYLVKHGYSKPGLAPWAMTGNYDITEYSFDSDKIFRISIHPQRNDKQMY